MNKADIFSLESTIDTVFVEVTNNIIEQSDILDELSIDDTTKNFIKTIVQCAKIEKEINSSQDEDQISVAWRSEVLTNQIRSKKSKKKTKGTNAIFSIRINELLKNGIVSLEIHSIPKNIANQKTRIKKIYHYKLSSFAKMYNLQSSKQPKVISRERRVSASMVADQKMSVFRKGGVNLVNKDELIHYQEQLVNGLLDMCMRVSQKDKRRSISVSCEINGGELKITSYCSMKEGLDLLKMNDQRAMRSIVSYCKKEIEHLKLKLRDRHGSDFSLNMIPNLFNVQIDDICTIMNMIPTTANFISIYEMMDRLSDTTFEVDASDNSWFQDNFSMMFKNLNDGTTISSNVFKIRLLTNFETASVPDFLESDNKIPRLFSFSLENRMFYNLLKDDNFSLFLSHSELSSERSGIIQRFYNWAKGKFAGGGNRTNLENKWFDGRELMAELVPHEIRYDNFSRYLLAAIRKPRFSKEKSCFENKTQSRHLIYGFFVDYKRVGRSHHFRFSRDRNDEIVGDKSRHKVHVMHTQNLLAYD